VLCDASPLSLLHFASLLLRLLLCALREAFCSVSCASAMFLLSSLAVFCSVRASGVLWTCALLSLLLTLRSSAALCVALCR
jgi:hypothetical protein